MRLHVRHATSYAYDQPMRFVVQSHRLTPSQSAGQKVLEWSVTAEGAAFGASFVDGAGDRVSTMTVHGPVSRIDILVEGLVETTDTAGVLRGLREVVSPRAYLRSSPATKANGALTVLKDEALARAGDADELARAHLLSAAVSEAIAYRPGSSDAHTTAAEALEMGEGVCQDHAHALIALAHAAELPARYVTGYLLAGDEGDADQASHAWAEVHVTGLGWVGFDAANRCCPDERYIRLASGRDAVGAAPIRGMSRGGGEEAMEVSVVVASAGQSQSQTQQ
jgi:transglutaminase-like putative cysteine protease